MLSSKQGELYRYYLLHVLSATAYNCLEYCFILMHHASLHLCLLPYSSYVYDSSGTHLMAVEVSEQSARYQYNEYGDLIEIIEATQERRTFLYDDRGLLVEAAVFSDTHQLVSSLAVSYDWSGLVTMILQPENRTLASYIDPQGRPKSLSTSPFSPPMLQIDLPTSEGRMLAVGNRVSVYIVYNMVLYIIVVETVHAGGSGSGSGCGSHSII